MTLTLPMHSKEEVDAAVGHLLGASTHRRRFRPGLSVSVAPGGGPGGEFVGVEVDGDDASGIGHHRTLDHRQTDAAQPEHRDRRTRLPDLGGI